MNNLKAKIIAVVVFAAVIGGIVALVITNSPGETTYKGQRELISLLQKHVLNDNQYFDIRRISFYEELRDVVDFDFNFETTILGRTESIFKAEEKNGSTELEIMLYATGEDYANIGTKFRIAKGGGGILILKDITKSKRLGNISDKEIEEEIIPKLLDALRDYLRSYSKWITLEKRVEIQELSYLRGLSNIWRDSCERYFRNKRKLSVLLEQKGDDVFMKQAIDSYLCQAYLPLDFKFGNKDVQILIGKEKFEVEKRFEPKKIAIGDQEFEIIFAGWNRMATVPGMDNTKAIKILQTGISQLDGRNSKTWDRMREISRQQNLKRAKELEQKRKNQEALERGKLMKERQEIEQLLSL